MLSAEVGKLSESRISTFLVRSLQLLWQSGEYFLGKRTTSATETLISSPKSRASQGAASCLVFFILFLFYFLFFCFFAWCGTSRHWGRRCSWGCRGHRWFRRYTSRHQCPHIFGWTGTQQQAEAQLGVLSWVGDNGSNLFCNHWHCVSRDLASSPKTGWTLLQDFRSLFSLRSRHSAPRFLANVSRILRLYNLLLKNQVAKCNHLKMKLKGKPTKNEFTHCLMKTFYNGMEWETKCSQNPGVAKKNYLCRVPLCRRYWQQRWQEVNTQRQSKGTFLNAWVTKWNLSYILLCEGWP